MNRLQSIYLPPLGFEGHFFFYLLTLYPASFAFSPSSFEQQIVKPGDSLDRLAKKTEFIIEVIAWSLKVIHSPPLFFLSLSSTE